MGGIKLILPCRSRIHSLMEGNRTDYTALSWWVVGQMGKPAVIEAGPGTAMISIRLNARGAYKLLPVVMRELTDCSVPASDIWGPSVGELQEQLAYRSASEERIALLQAYLVRQFAYSTRSDAFVDYALNQVMVSRGQIRIEELCREAGYTKQHLDRRFAELVGVSPKQYADIVRFYKFYRMFKLAEGKRIDEMYDAYYDQSHFIKTFRKYTGFSPRDYQKQGNLLGSMFLK